VKTSSQTRDAQKSIASKRSKLFGEQICRLSKFAETYVIAREKRDYILKLTAAALSQLELAMDTGASQTKIGNAEIKYELLVNAFVELETVVRAGVDDLEAVASIVDNALNGDARRPSASSKRAASELGTNRRTSSKNRSRRGTSVNKRRRRTSVATEGRRAVLPS
jgi:hypothetical protein